jgi:Ca2+-binding EF-hand superfamily protein
MKQNFKQIDLDGDGFLSPDEIKLAAKTDSDLAPLDADRKAQFEIKRLVNDGRNDARGISMRDVQAFGAQEVAARHAQNDPQDLKLAAEFLNKYFNKIDRNHTGFITKSDLEDLIAEPTLKFAFRQKFLLTERYFEPISELNREKILKAKEHAGLSQDDLKILIANDGKFYRR